MKFSRYYITNTLGYEAMIHCLFFLWIIKTNCDCSFELEKSHQSQY